MCSSGLLRRYSSFRAKGGRTRWGRRTGAGPTAINWIELFRTLSVHNVAALRWWGGVWSGAHSKQTMVIGLMTPVADRMTYTRGQSRDRIAGEERRRRARELGVGLSWSGVGRGGQEVNGFRSAEIRRPTGSHFYFLRNAVAVYIIQDGLVRRTISDIQVADEARKSDSQLTLRKS